MSERLLWLDAECPVCQARPPIKVPLGEVALARALPPDQVRLTYRCHCGTVLRLKARDFARAA